MGIGAGTFLIALGAILTFALRVDADWIDLNAIGIILMATGATLIVWTLWFWQARRRRGVRSLVEETRLAHESGPVTPDPPDVELRNP
jgi:Flp pilus assembly protein TadB